jgi:uncharacterized membrane protein YkgB
MNTAIERMLAVTADPASNRLATAAMKIAIAVLFLWICVLKFANRIALARNGASAATEP